MKKENRLDKGRFILLKSSSQNFLIQALIDALFRNEEMIPSFISHRQLFRVHKKQ